jgi:putative ABC transport system permease protein
MPVPQDDHAIEVVGVAGDVRYEDIESEAKPAIFFPAARLTRSRAMLFVRTAGDPASLANAVGNAVRAVDRNHTVSDVQTLRHCMYEATARDRFTTQVLSSFAATALVLAAIAIYGVLSLAWARSARWSPAAR